ncbi:16S rRNA (guanine(966)-N(2))-methyltransferase RsmD [Enterobacteriaceae bacterium ET-AT1-13]|nr:16S rRNA (guanine(966)-N(2))-methyltransferase RsmD [Enterobacteriaceae bacterium ET-AT1-13]WGS66390.1 16S rRNA (guanine(966)-N(2))-methyltransferase RsmD [Enterobacteriaceae bacterium Cmel17]WMC17416.1 MAG: 16S rRNA (guanine(966)-N(2))-methyltransferase RsmD [Enterobacteriaceae bacterium Cmel21]WMC17622.1 MAG: 16S rRNA (guanine(966)-N(2))-methyltransferase RsmD [Enterobacteriaceae bacterium PSmelAO3-2]WMC17827.1 MAG: 16S rRNA (guanine(966)-N(2))-methyltransferase RsmD [Enterobacteriaceae ba
MSNYKNINLFKNKKNINKININTGKWKNYKLFINNNYNLRPTTSIIKKILFNWIKPIIKNSICLDCFAGSGSLGIEALSNYANKVFFLDNNKNIINQLKQNLKLLNYNNYNNCVININTINWLNIKSKVRFNIVFLDPPFKKNLLNKTINLLEKNKYLSNTSLIYIESKKKKIIKLPKNWYIKKIKIIGNVLIRLYLRLNI